MGPKARRTTARCSEWQLLRDRCAKALRADFRAASNDDIEDAVSDAIESLCRGAPPHVLQSDAMRAGWMLTTSKRILLRRVKRREREVSLESILDSDTPWPFAPSTDLHHVEQGIDAVWFLRQLNSKDRAILQLTFTGFPKEQLAEMYQCSVKAIDERNRRSIRKLQKIAGIAPPPGAGPPMGTEEYQVTTDATADRLIQSARDSFFHTSVWKIQALCHLCSMRQLPLIRATCLRADVLDENSQFCKSPSPGSSR